ncbi:ribosome silencing factor [Zoogloea sp.]|uniref:ribosome silencing factor n=1 Tax=Zoogloea sp. TaxID=49181 RepID=UPI0035AE3950|nr:ribosome silencing factor [Rhodocyclales bacterium]
MDINTYEALVISALEDIKGKEIQVINTTRLTALFDRVIIASGDSNRQTRALARNVTDKAREAGQEVISIEGNDTGEWVLVDLGAIVVHIMQPAVRSYYKLEDLWANAPSRLVPANGGIARVAA